MTAILSNIEKMPHVSTYEAGKLLYASSMVGGFFVTTVGGLWLTGGNILLGGPLWFIFGVGVMFYIGVTAAMPFRSQKVIGRAGNHLWVYRSKWPVFLRQANAARELEFITALPVAGLRIEVRDTPGNPGQLSIRFYDIFAIEAGRTIILIRGIMSVDDASELRHRVQALADLPLVDEATHNAQRTARGAAPVAAASPVASSPERGDGFDL